MRAFVTGATGFVGGHLQAHLQAMGDEVVAADEDLDINDRPRVAQAIIAAKPDVVYHLAALSHVGKSWSEPERTFQVNALGTLCVLEVARQCEKPPVVLLVSSAEVYGIVKADELPLAEDSALMPATPYATSKVAAEFIGLQAFLSYGLPVVRVRSFNHIGPGQAPAFSVPGLARRIALAQASGDTKIPVGVLTMTRDFTDVRDVVRAYRLLVRMGQPGEVYNVCSGKDVSIRDIAEKLIALAGTNIELEFDPSLVREVDVPALRGDAGRLRALTGWKPTIGLDETLKEVMRAAQAEVSKAVNTL